ncbi:MAG: hypothetical protein EWV49_05320 [Microcystis aeruginosa Ma_QC_Ch_20071001_S25]|uniref:Uncharacterized protein n=1 Tax=Microcystis aeruginosa Ma_QC_Ch_20071001_S25D TaxID=2486250 RepID=A0A552FJ74_MICAE|nr:MAG: hypothetical protein EWV57_17910 [Microcystis aeruginosa Ma_QC_Ch_20071001_S25D]TRU52503.1 MAG: hypothetical protein EWV49_05320 [Microcystis aeruginosa Ma_QC_Ch_20071001_S25]TRU62905.1 MAG: hypothetical protein EWV90_09815 [Microcystis aeruginosa Ma_QC_Ch_20071001_M135]
MVGFRFFNRIEPFSTPYCFAQPNLRGFIFRKNAVTWNITESARMLSQNRRLHLLIAEAELSLTALF